jgi:hypothetical protein
LANTIGIQAPREPVVVYEIYGTNVAERFEEQPPGCDGEVKGRFKRP